MTQRWVDWRVSHYQLYSILTFSLVWVHAFWGASPVARLHQHIPKDSLRIKGSIKVGSSVRHYILHLPENQEQAGLHPLVFVLHGARSNPRNMEKMSEFQQQDNGNLITVYPASAGNFWNDGRAMADTSIHDVTFINTLADTLASRYKVDRDAIFSTGISNGATMSVRLACQSPKIKAVAGVASTAVKQVIDNCYLDESKSFLLIKGTNDPISNFDGEFTPKRSIVGYNYAIQRYLELDQCSDAPVNAPLINSADGKTSVTRKIYHHCADGAEVIGVVVKNGGHTWPGAPKIRSPLVVGRTSQVFNASSLIWNYFQRQIPDESSTAAE